MKNLKSVVGFALITLAIGFSSCTQEEAIEGFMDKTEITSPASHRQESGSSIDTPHRTI